MMKLLINLFQTYLRASMRQVRGNLMYSYIWHFLLVNSFVLWIFHYLIGCIWFISCVVNPILEMATKRRNLQFFFFLFCHGWSRGHDAGHDADLTWQIRSQHGEYSGNNLSWSIDVIWGILDFIFIILKILSYLFLISFPCWFGNLKPINTHLWVRLSISCLLFLLLLCFHFNKIFFFVLFLLYFILFYVFTLSKHVKHDNQYHAWLIFLKPRASTNQFLTWELNIA